MNSLLRSMLFVALASAAAPASASSHVILPEPDAKLTRIHSRFRWEPFENIVGNYLLRIVEDNGNAFPFMNGLPVMTHVVDASQPYAIIKDGLEFGKRYAWRAEALVGPGPVQRMETPTRRFEIEPLPSFIPPISLTVPQGAGPVEPGYVLFGHLGFPGSAFQDGLVIIVDENAEIVHFFHHAIDRPILDVRMLEEHNRRGRLLWLTNGRGFESTLDGRVLWATHPERTVHHEISPLPGGDNLAMVTDERVLPDSGGGPPQMWLGDAILRVDRHTRETKWEWSTFDDYSTQDVHPVHGTEDWTHGNAAVLDPATQRIYLSMRSIDRVTCLDFVTGDVLYNMGNQNYPGGDVAFGHNLFSHQHAPHPLPNGNVIIFDNGNETEPLSAPRQTRAVELTFDDRTNPTSASIAWKYDAVDDQDNPIFTPFVGDADRLPGGNTLVTLGSIATIDEVDAAGNLLWRMKVGVGAPMNIIYRSEKIPEVIVDTPGDADGDWDVDMADFARLQAAHGRTQLQFPDTLVDFDADGVLNPVDANLFGFWQTGPSRTR